MWGFQASTSRQTSLIVRHLEVDEAGGLLLEVGEHRGEGLAAEAGLGAHAGELGHRLQEVGVGVGRGRAGEQCRELRGGQQLLHGAHVGGVVSPPRHHLVHLGVVQGAGALAQLSNLRSYRL